MAKDMLSSPNSSATNGASADSDGSAMTYQPLPRKPDRAGAACVGGQTAVIAEATEIRLEGEFEAVAAEARRTAERAVIATAQAAARAAALAQADLIATTALAADKAAGAAETARTDMISRTGLAADMVAGAAETARTNLIATTGLAADKAAGAAETARTDLAAAAALAAGKVAAAAMLAALEARIRSEEVAEDASVKGSAAVSRLREIGSNEARFAANNLAERVVATAITRAEQTAVAARLAAQTVREEAARMVALTDARADAAELNVRQALDAVRALTKQAVLDIDSATAQAAVAADLYADAHDTRAGDVGVKGQDRVAFDLHDRVIQELWGLGMGLQGLAHPNDPDEDISRLTYYIAALDQTLNTVRASSFHLREHTTAPPS